MAREANQSPVNSVMNNIGSILVSTKVYDQNETNIKCATLFGLSTAEEFKSFIVENWNENIYNKVQQHVSLLLSIRQ